MKSLLKVSAAALFAVNVSSAFAVEGYVTAGQDPEVPVRSRFGECVHDYAWHEGLRFADCEPKPAPVAAPAPVVEEVLVEEVVVVQAAPQPVPVNVPFRLSTDSFFDFDKTTLRAEGRAALDDVAQRLAVTQYDTITIVGHADRIGTKAYNQKLSEKRAQVMRDYLVANGVDAQKIAASGVGSSEPTTQCGHLRGARLIACLQPDRFAEVTVSGTATVSQR